jgi:hypothetical protein
MRRPRPTRGLPRQERKIMINSMEQRAYGNNGSTRHKCLLSIPQEPATSPCPKPQQFSPFAPSLFITIHFNNLNPMQKLWKWFPSFWFYYQNFGRIFLLSVPTCHHASDNWRRLQIMMQFSTNSQYSRTPLIRTLVIRIANYTDQLGPFG